MRKILDKIYHLLFLPYNLDICSENICNISELDHKITKNIEEDVNLNVNSAFRY